MTPVKDSLTALNSQLTHVENQRHAQAAELGEQVRQVMATGESLRRETNALLDGAAQATGARSVGELQLHRVVEIAGMLDHCDFYEQASGVTRPIPASGRT